VTSRCQISRNIGEARITRDHNIDRKKWLLPGDALGHFHRHRARCEQDGMARELIAFQWAFAAPASATRERPLF
jgi:hypothetical protein